MPTDIKPQYGGHVANAADATYSSKLNDSYSTSQTDSGDRQCDDTEDCSHLTEQVSKASLADDTVPADSKKLEPLMEMDEDEYYDNVNTTNENNENIADNERNDELQEDLEDDVFHDESDAVNTQEDLPGTDPVDCQSEEQSLTKDEEKSVQRYSPERDLAETRTESSGSDQPSGKQGVHVSYAGKTENLENGCIVDDILCSESDYRENMISTNDTSSHDDANEELMLHNDVELSEGNETTDLSREQEQEHQNAMNDVAQIEHDNINCEEVDTKSESRQAQVEGTEHQVDQINEVAQSDSLQNDQILPVENSPDDSLADHTKRADIGDVLKEDAVITTDIDNVLKEEATVTSNTEAPKLGTDIEVALMEDTKTALDADVSVKKDAKISCDTEDTLKGDGLKSNLCNASFTDEAVREPGVDSSSPGEPSRGDLPQASAATISQENIKTQIHEIITEIEKHAPKEDTIEGLLTDDGPAHHTWQPKGTYRIERTVVEYEDVIPEKIPDVSVHDRKVPPPPPPQQQPPSLDAQTHPTEDYMDIDHEGPRVDLSAPLANGELASPIEIPEGIPLLARILPKENGGESKEKIPLERLFTPATDSGEITPRRKKAFSSSAFYAPNHPTIDDQVELAQKISFSLVDDNNRMSKGQNMYIKRKKRSVKWIHQGAGGGGGGEPEPEETAAPRKPKGKPNMKLLMNPKGVQDYTSVQQHYQELMESAVSTSSTRTVTPTSPEVTGDLVNDLQSPSGKGAALFAKRKKRMNKFIVDETNVQKSSVYYQQQQQQQHNLTNAMNTAHDSISGSVTPAGTTTPIPPTAPGSKKQWLAEKDRQQQQVMDEYWKNRRSAVKLVKSPWDAALETGNPTMAFEMNSDYNMASRLKDTVTERADFIMSGGTPSWFEMPKPVPVADPAQVNCAPAVPAGAPQPFTQTPESVCNHEAPQQTALYNTSSFSPTNFISNDNPAGTAPLRRPPLEKSAENHRLSANFNVAPTGWGMYNTHYKPTTFSAS